MLYIPAGFAILLVSKLWDAGATTGATMVVQLPHCISERRIDLPSQPAYRIGPGNGPPDVPVLHVRNTINLAIATFVEAFH